MNTIEIITNSHRGSASRGLVRRIAKAAVAGIVALTVVLGMSSVPANAATHVNRSGQIGSVSLNGPMINAWTSAWNGLGYSTIYSKNFNVGGFTVTRSPSSNSQVVVGAAYIQRLVSGRWTTVQTRTWNGTVSGNGTLRFPSWTWSPTQVQNNRYMYRVVFGIAWSDSSSRRTLGTTYVVPNTATDNRCASSLPCTSYNTGVNF